MRANRCIKQGALKAGEAEVDGAQGCIDWFVDYAQGVCVLGLGKADAEVWGFGDLVGGARLVAESAVDGILGQGLWTRRLGRGKFGGEIVGLWDLLGEAMEEEGGVVREVTLVAKSKEDGIQRNITPRVACFFAVGRGEWENDAFELAGLEEELDELGRGCGLGEVPCGTFIFDGFL